jgi:type I restriction enzyme S subunit
VNTYKWLDSIPTDWVVARADALLEYNKTPAHISDFENIDVFHYSIPAIQDLGDGIIQNSSEIDSDKILLEGGELIISKLNPRKGCVFLTKPSSYPILCSSEFVPLTMKQVYNSRYAYYVFLSQQVREILSSVVQSVTKSHQRANPDDIRKIWLPVPPKREQSEIADFLDRETSRIDALISTKENILKLLAEKRKALITRAVTRGLDPDVPLRDSGVPWLGMVPVHWETTKIAWLYRDRDQREEPELPLLEVSINSGVVLREFSDDKIESTASDFNTYKVARKGDIVFNKMRMWQGAVGVAPQDGLVSPDYQVAEPTGDLLSSYAGLLFRTEAFSAECARWSHGITWDRLRLYWDGFREIVVPVPPENEQKEILNYLNDETTKIDALKVATENTIELLKERRSALISEAVMGKLKVDNKQ